MSLVRYAELLEGRAETSIHRAGERLDDEESDLERKRDRLEHPRILGEESGCP